MPFQYPARVSVHGNEVVVEFRDLPGVAGGATREEALKAAEGVLEASLAVHLNDGLEIPPASKAGPDDVLISATSSMIARLARAGDEEAEDEMAGRIVDRHLANPSLSLPLEVWDEIEAAPSPIGPLRRWRGETVETLAAKAGLSVTELVEIEAGREAPCDKALSDLAQALLVHVTDLMTD